MLMKLVFWSLIAHSISIVYLCRRVSLQQIAQKMTCRKNKSRREKESSTSQRYQDQIERGKSQTGGSFYWRSLFWSQNSFQGFIVLKHNQQPGFLSNIKYRWLLTIRGLTIHELKNQEWRGKTAIFSLNYLYLSL